MRDIINLLLVDDNCDFLEMIHDMLVSEGISVKSVETVSGANQILQDYDVDAIICDYNLPDSNGIQFLQTIRKAGLLTPFILISGSLNSEMLLSTLRLGAFDFIEKPIHFDHLIQIISQAVNSGIQNRLLQERIKNKLSPEDYKLVLNSLRTISKLRCSNFDNMKKKDNAA